MIRIKNVKIEYTQVLLENLSIDIPRGCLTLIKGKSGSGKTSLLYRIGLISDNQNFQYIIDSVDIMELNDEEKSLFKRKKMSFVLQDCSLFEQYDVIGNLQLYSTFNNLQYSEEEYLDILHKVHLHISLHQSIETLSGGEKQRLAIACALCKKVDILILDEPTSSLDCENEQLIFSILKNIAYFDNKYVIVASHSANASDFSDQIYEINDRKMSCLKTFSERDEGSYKEIKKEYIGKTFYMSYIKYFHKKYSKSIKILTGILCCSFIIMNISSLLINKYITDSQKSIADLSENQMFITSHKSHIYINSDLSAFDIKKDYTFDQDTAIYPYINTYGLVNGNSVVIVPYFEQNNMKSKELASYSNQGIYLSYSLYRELANQAVDYKNISMELLLQYTDNSKEKVLSIPISTYKVKGVLKDNVKCSYVQNEKMYIYMDYRALNEIYSKNHLNTLEMYKGYTVLTKDFFSYTGIGEKLKDTDLGVNQFFSGFKEIQNMINNLYLFKLGLTLFLIVVTLFVFNVIEINYFYKRQKEFALLKTNGISNKMIFKLVGIELVVQMCFTLLSVFIISTIILIFIGQVENLISLFYSNLMGIIIIFIVSLIFSKKNMSKLIPENVFRQ